MVVEVEAADVVFTAVDARMFGEVCSEKLTLFGSIAPIAETNVPDVTCAVDGIPSLEALSTPRLSAVSARRTSVEGIVGFDGVTRDAALLLVWQSPPPDVCAHDKVQQ